MKATVYLSKNVSLELEEMNEMVTLHKAIVFSNPRHYCNICKNDDENKFYFTTNQDKDGNIYVNNKCRACGARSKLGQYKNKTGYFWREFEQWKPSTGSTQSAEGDDSTA